MIITVVIIAAVVYLAFHLGAGHSHYRYQKAHHRSAGGLRPNFYWSSVRGPYASVRLPGGWRVGHRL
jgi:hypothetical protein